MADEVNVTPSSAGAPAGGPSAAAVPRGPAWADMIVRVVAMIILLGVAVQFLLAGAGAFGMDTRAHVELGRGVGYLTVLLLLAVLLARAGGRDIAIAVALAVLAFFGQGFLAEIARGDASWVGALHVIGGFLIGGLGSQLLAGAGRRMKARKQAG